ncbi:MAG: GNAT family N-acetyltransferase [Frankiales bacterium]|nr:MAG: GNAT family N-acetyltransferase [Frankiales bacterium]
MTNLRRAGAADAADLTRLRGLMLSAMGRDVSVPGWADACEAAFARRLAEPDRFAAWVVEVDGRAVSSGVGWLEEHLPAPGTVDGRRGHIASMSTEPEHQRRGHGRRVFTALMDWFASLGVPRVDLRATPDGRPLYEAFGFRELGGATMAWTRPGTPEPGLGFVRAD